MKNTIDYPWEANNRCFVCKKTVFNIETLKGSKRNYVLCDKCFDIKKNESDICKMKIFNHFTKGSENVSINRWQS